MRKIFVVAALIISSQLHAQRVPQQKEDSSKLMNEVTLTATKYSLKTTQTGKVVTIITRQDIEHAGSRDLSQVITEMGGVFINGFSSNLGKEKNIYLRGAKVDYTLIAIDGVPVYDASGIGSNFDIRNISIDNIERIEILKGSQSTLYGSDAIAGVINIITKKSSIKPFVVSGVADYGSYNTFRGNLNINGSQKKFDYNIGYSYLNTNGFSEARKPAASSGVFDKDGYRQNSVQASLGIQAGKWVRAQPFFRYTKFKGNLDQNAFVDEKDYTNTNENIQGGIRNIINAGKGKINMVYQFTSTNRYYLDDSTNSRNGYYLYNQLAYNAREHFAEAFLVYPIKALKLTAGADFRSSNTDYTSLTVSPPFPPYVPTETVTRSSSSGDSIQQKQYGVYAALNFASTHFSAEAGGRINRHSEYGNNAAFNINLSYLMHTNVKLFTNLSSGYKTPSLYQLFSLYGNKNLQPESSLTGEAGVQLFTDDQNHSLRADYFARTSKEVIAFLSLPTYPYGRYINQDQQKDHGIEVELNSKFSDKLQLKAFYSYVTGKVTTQQNGKDTTYFNLLRRPKSTFNFFAGSQLTKAFYVNLQLNVIGKRKDIYFPPPTYAQQNITLKSYTLLNFYAEYSLLKTRLKIFADLRNILNQDYMDIYGYNTARFNVYGGIRFLF